MSKVKFYSEHDLACGWELAKVIERINEDVIEKVWTINDVVEFYNILKYIQIQRFVDYLEEKTDIDCREFEMKIQQKIGRFIGEKQHAFIELYDELEFSDVDDYFEIFERCRIYKEISEDDFRVLIDKKYVHVYHVLKFRRTTARFDNILKEKILSDPRNAETIISKLLGESKLFLPPSLSEEEILVLLDEYIESSEVNINFLREIITLPVSNEINIPDRIKLNAARKEKAEVEKLFSEGSGHETSISIYYRENQEEAIILNGAGVTTELKVSRNWIEDNLDFPTLWNNFIYLFDIVDDKFRLTIDSKVNDTSVFESLFQPHRDHLYRNTISFNFKELYADTVVQSYIRILKAFNIKIEDMIKWFFCEYLKEEFSVNDFIVKMPTELSSHLDKCRTILPEIDRIFKQYNALIEDGEIDQELIQMSSSSVRSDGVKTFISKKYAYPLTGWYETASYLLFSDQSGIFYIPSKKEFRNFLELIIRDDVKKSEFEEYQLKKMQWLFENNLVYENEDGFVKVFDSITVYILKELYYKDVLSYWHYPEVIRAKINDLEIKKVIMFESTLLSRNEQDYLDFYLNKAKFTNGYDLRNRYLHGTNVNDENQHEADYYSILKLLIILIIKINDDLCIKNKLSSV